jgi:hypothetical protein
MSGAGFPACEWPRKRLRNAGWKACATLFAKANASFCRTLKRIGNRMDARGRWAHCGKAAGTQPRRIRICGMEPVPRRTPLSSTPIIPGKSCHHPRKGCERPHPEGSERTPARGPDSQRESGAWTRVAARARHSDIHRRHGSPARQGNPTAARKSRVASERQILFNFLLDNERC